jgi:hypothetical protein
MNVAQANSRAKTGFAMAKSEAHAMRAFLEARRLALLEEVKTIEKFLASNPTQRVDQWYEAIDRVEP